MATEFFKPSEGFFIHFEKLGAEAKQWIKKSTGTALSFVASASLVAALVVAVPASQALGQVGVRHATVFQTDGAGPPEPFEPDFIFPRAAAPSVALVKHLNLTQRIESADHLDFEDLD